MIRRIFYAVSVVLFFALAFFFFNLLSSKAGGNIFVFCPEEIEHFGERYSVVKIGDRCWLGENLRTTKYLDGTEIPRLDSDSEWENAEGGAYSVYSGFFYPNKGIFEEDDSCDVGMGEEWDEEWDKEGRNILIDDDTIIRKFGMLYNFHAVNNSVGICPEGWSVPTHDDWTALERAVCTSSTCESDFPFDVMNLGFRGTNEGSKLAGYFDFWYDGFLNGGDNFGVSNFNALPGGYRDTLGFFLGQGSSAYFWASVDSEDGSWVREIHDFETGILRQYLEFFGGGFSVRCVMGK